MHVLAINVHVAPAQEKKLIAFIKWKNSIIASGWNRPGWFQS
jgi:hypothetical protein